MKCRKKGGVVGEREWQRDADRQAPSVMYSCWFVDPRTSLAGTVKSKRTYALCCYAMSSPWQPTGFSWITSEWKHFMHTMLLLRVYSGFALNSIWGCCWLSSKLNYRRELWWCSKHKQQHLREKTVVSQSRVTIFIVLQAIITNCIFFPRCVCLAAYHSCQQEEVVLLGGISSWPPHRVRVEIFVHMPQ